jgi:flagellar basal body rod protein FlgC
MVSGISTALSGYDAAVTQLAVSANNIAKSTNAGGGVTTSGAVSPASYITYDPANPAANAQGIVRTPNPDLVQQVVNANTAGYDAQANLTSLAVQNELSQKALNIVS